MLEENEIKFATSISYFNYKEKIEIKGKIKKKRLKDNHGFLVDIIFEYEKNHIYISFKGINSLTLKSKNFSKNLTTGGALQYSENFYVLKKWINIFINKYSKNKKELKVTIIGHSLGGAFSQMLTFDFLYGNISKENINPKNITNVTFNSLGGKVGNHFLNTEYNSVIKREKRKTPFVKHKIKQIKTFHFVHKEDIVAKILKHENHESIYIIGVNEKNLINSFYGNINCHDIDIFYEMINKNLFVPVKAGSCENSQFSYFKLEEFLMSWKSVIGLFYLYMFKTNQNYNNIINPIKYYDVYNQIQETKIEIMNKYNKFKNHEKLKSVINE